MSSLNPVISATGRSEVDIFVRYATVNPASMADAADSTLSVTVTDVEIGDDVRAVAPYDGQGMIVGCVVSAANTVDLSFHNASGGVVDLASGTWKFIVTRTA